MAMAGPSSKLLSSSAFQTQIDLRGQSTRPKRRKANVLLFLTEKIAPETLPYILHKPNVNLRLISDCSRQNLGSGIDSLDRVDWFANSPDDEDRRHVQTRGHQLARWADVLYVVVDARLTSLMLAGFTNDLILNILRCWDTSKKIVMLPELSKDQWKHPLWKSQMVKIQRKWAWVQVLRPALWDIEEEEQLGNPVLLKPWNPRITWEWEGPEESVEALDSEVQNVVRISQSDTSRLTSRRASQQSLSEFEDQPHMKPRLPPEIWTIILDLLGDWEVATALGIYTHIPVPYEWVSHISRLNSRPPQRSTLEYTILTAPISTIRVALSQASNSFTGPTTLSPLATKLIFKFSLTPILSYLASHQKDIFWTSFGLALLPHKASLVYNSPAILEWWRTCPAVLKKEYGPEALDGASRAGFVEVLDWWLHSGLHMWYTEKALESASAKGHIDVLEWWKQASASRHGTEHELALKVGKSILAAAQSGRAETVAWWDASGIPYAHEDGVARLASTYGHTEVLALWKELKGSKMIFDNQVLVGPTKNGHAGVLEWWKRSGLRVEYKTCDIEEAMEDAVGGGGEGEVREWWGRNGLNLGVGTGEWMKVKTLCE